MRGKTLMIPQGLPVVARATMELPPTPVSASGIYPNDFQGSYYNIRGVIRFFVVREPMVRLGSGKPGFGSLLCHEILLGKLGPVTYSYPKLPQRVGGG